MLKLNSATWKQEIKTDKKDELSCVIGDDKQPDFIPQMKIERFSNECNVSIRLIEDKDEEKETPTIVEEDGRIKHIKSKRECHFYNLGISAEHPEDASEFEVILKEKPATNVVQFSLEDKDVDYFYQPALTPEEIARGDKRSENVEGSYAIYAKTPKHNYVGEKEYKVGKVGHIFRPKIIDSAGTEVWGDLHIENGILSVTIPQDFLDKAVYPVKHAAGLTFGNTTAGATKSSLQASSANCVGLIKNALTASTGDTITKFTISAAKDVSNITIGLAAYTQVSSLPVNILDTPANTASITLTSQAWYDTSAVSQAMSNGVIYNVAFGNRSGGCYVWYDTGTGAERSLDDNSVPVGQLPATWASVGTSAARYSVYATYTAGGGAASPNHLMRLMGCGN